MSTPHYVAVKVGDNYEFRRVDTDYRLKVGTAIGGGLLLSLLGLKKGRLAGTAMTAVGAGLLYYGWTGKSPVRVIKKLGSTLASLPEGSPSHPHDHQIESNQTPQDSVDEAAMESFPASDPPARSASTSVT